jgi:hypothetical protein
LTKITIILFFGVFTSIVAVSQTREYTKNKKNSGWQIIPVATLPTAREDCGFVEVDGKFYLIGGRGILHVEIFDPAANIWTRKSKTPFEVHHFQPVVYQKEIYVVGAMAGKFPHEQPFENIYIYNPAKDEWRKSVEIPKDRRRGSGGAVVYKDKIYFVGGITDGHYEGTVTWFDVFDPAAARWDTLSRAPQARDHFNAVVIKDKLYVAGGRRTSFKTKQTGDLTVPEVDVYDFKRQQWATLPLQQNLPTQRAGSTSVTYKAKLLVIGGESVTQTSSHHEVEVYDLKQGKWDTLPTLVTGRHDTQAVVYKNKIYIAAGSANRGGGPDQNTIEVLDLKKN